MDVDIISDRTTPQRAYSGQRTWSPGTPKLPVSPPRRSSSLAFPEKASSQLLLLANCLDRGPRKVSSPNISKKRIISSSPAQSSPFSIHLSSIQQVLFEARVSLHRDAQAASLPESSIESRMDVEKVTPTANEAVRSTMKNTPLGEIPVDWRYSTAPLTLAAANLDVREPIPLSECHDKNTFSEVYQYDLTEPTSNGFLTPTKRYSTSKSLSPRLIALPLSDPLSDDKSYDLDTRPSLHLIENSRHTPELNRSMLKLSMSLRDMTMDEQQGSNRDLYLSPSAEAAARSAKAKRALLMTDRNHTSFNDEVGPEHVDGFCGRGFKLTCPNPEVHKSKCVLRCPDPALHRYIRTPETINPSGSPQFPDSSQMDHPSGLPMPYYPPTNSRTTATGSPLPFVRPRARTAIPQDDGKVAFASPVPSSVYRPLDSAATRINEHFSPGWYYAREATTPSQVLDAQPEYSFSAAMAKIQGEGPAPYSWIHDSYKTDTLTTLSVPKSRFRKNGIGAEIAQRGVNRYYQRPYPHDHHPSTSLRTGNRTGSYASPDIRFRSSPPRAMEIMQRTRRKRAADDTFSPEARTLVAKDSYGMISLNSDTNAAVRMSIFGNNAPELRLQSRSGIRPLSPNVELSRKYQGKHVHLRKKRRPSYWDNDLSEIRDSPAGRGGIHSPVSAQASMRADVDMVSMRTGQTGRESYENRSSAEHNKQNLQARGRDEDVEMVTGDRLEELELEQTSAGDRSSKHLSGALIA